MKVPQCLYGCKPAQMTEKQPSVELALLPGVSVESNTCPYHPPLKPTQLPQAVGFIL